MSKGEAFVKEHIPDTKPAIYDNYEAVYADANVDIIYIGTPHAFHKKNALDAIRAHKHVLCEKAFTITAAEAAEVLAAAQREGVFVMEAMWLRFRPLVFELRRQLFDENVIGEVQRTFCDFGLKMDLGKLDATSRLKNPALGAGSLLDIGVYSLTWGLLTLDAKDGDEADEPQITGVQTLREGIDMASTVILKYASTGRQGVLTSSLEFQSGSTFCRIEGSEGYIEVSGLAPSVPSAFIVYCRKNADTVADGPDGGKPKGKVFNFEQPGFGFYYEADAVALDIEAGKLENAVMPHAETMRVMKMMDTVRAQGGARFPQDSL